MLYETDIIEWVEQQIALIQEQRYSEVDWTNLLEEIEDVNENAIAFYLQFASSFNIY